MHDGYMQTTQTFHRWHRTDTPTFTPENAWSADWGSDFTDDGTSYTCPACDGTGEQAPEIHNTCDGAGCHHCDNGMITDCDDCDGDGTIDCERGYSCYEDADELVAYFRERGGEPRDDWGTVYVFEGDMAGNGTDGEPLVVPTRIVETLTWSELVARAEAEEAA